MLADLIKKRIFIGTTEIAGYYKNLARGFDELGLNYAYVQLSPNSSGFGSQSKLPFLIKLPYHIAQFRLAISVEPGLYTTHKIKPGLRSLLRFPCYFFENLLRTMVVLPWSIFKFDIFCFGARSNIVGIKAGYWDIRLLKLLRKKIIFVYHGSDSRPPYIDGSIFHYLKKFDPDWSSTLNTLTKRTSDAVHTLDKLADVVIDNPYSAHFHHRPFVNWFALGMPTYNHEVTFNQTVHHEGGLLRILHAPTHKIAKGSQVITDCIEQLKQEGYPLELILLNGRPHDDVIAAIKQCDFVIDELYSDVLMAGFATEASYYAKPVIACGYVDDKTLKKHIPTLYCRPERLNEAVLTLIHDSDFRMALGLRAQHFVKTQWASLTVAKHFMKIFSNEIPMEWMVNPNSIAYLHGFGLEENLLKQYLSSFIQTQGLSALRLDDKPKLRDAFLHFAQTENL